MFRENHILAFFKLWQETKGPLDRSLSFYFKAHRSLGSHDRKEIGEIIYTLVRWESLFDFIEPSSSISKRLQLLKQRPVAEWASLEHLPDWAKAGVPPFLYDKIKNKDTCKAMQANSPIAIRANLLKTDREKLLKTLSDRFHAIPSNIAPAAIRFSKREPLFSTQEFKQGLFEVQDEGSQLIADLVAVEPKQKVLDYCAGSGGKSLAIAPKMGGLGELYLHDIRPKALAEARLRLRRAGVQNAQILASGHPQIEKLKGNIDWVLVDAPCSGSGTLRRNPEMKKKIDAPLINRLVLEQRKILTESVRFLKKKGKLVYATCSIFREENEEQIDWIETNLDLQLAQKPLCITLTPDGPDGFFGAVFTKKIPKK